VSDLIFLVVVIAFFALAALGIRACELIAGPGTPTGGDTEP
jgi:small-conductance mechanosensitive channel